MTLYILSNPKKIGGVFQWEKYVNNCTIIYDINIKFDSGDMIYVNNYTCCDFFNTQYLQFLNGKNILLYFVAHSDLCPINKLFVLHMKHFYGVVSTNKFVYDKILRLHPTLDNIYLPNTVENNIQTNMSNRKSNKLKLIYVGRLAPEKNLPMLLYAIKDLLNVVLYIYGEDKSKYGNYLKALCMLFKISSRVVFMGFCDDKNTIYNDGCVVLPSVHEGLPYCLLEAQSYNIPIICNDISGIKNHINNCEYNIFYQYDGYSLDLTNVLYVESYAIMLKMIGYVEYVVNIKDMITFNKNNSNCVELNTLREFVIYNSCDKFVVGSTHMVPPCLLSNNEKLCGKYNRNVQKIISAITSYFRALS